MHRTYVAEFWIFGATAVSLLTLVFFPRLLRDRTEGLLHPHGYCYIWDPVLVGSHVLADLLIGAAYVSISLTLGYLVWRVRHLLPFHWMFLAFGLFILTCGGTHFMDVWTLWYPDFWGSAALKIVTAVASVATALALPPLIPQIARLLHAANISEQAQAESQAKDLFLATLSHELRTPLNVIAGWMHILQHQGVDPAAQTKALEAIQRNIALQSRLVEDMLDVSSILTGRLRLQTARIDLRDVVRYAVEQVHEAAAGKRVRLEVDAPQAVAVSGDEVRLQQVLVNLLSNAVKFTEADGRIDVRLSAEGRQAVLRVVDSGEGIDPGFLPRVFDVFAQADQSATRTKGGLGLGLAIVRHLVQQHGGSVDAQSAGKGKGSTFTIRLPLAAD